MRAQAVLIGLSAVNLVIGIGCIVVGALLVTYKARYYVYYHGIIAGLLVFVAAIAGLAAAGAQGQRSRLIVSVVSSVIALLTTLGSVVICGLAMSTDNTMHYYDNPERCTTSCDSYGYAVAYNWDGSMVHQINMRKRRQANSDSFLGVDLSALFEAVGVDPSTAAKLASDASGTELDSYIQNVESSSSLFGAVDMVSLLKGVGLSPEEAERLSANPTLLEQYIADMEANNTVSAITNRNATVDSNLTNYYPCNMWHYLRCHPNKDAYNADVAMVALGSVTIVLLLLAFGFALYAVCFLQAYRMIQPTSAPTPEPGFQGASTPTPTPDHSHKFHRDTSDLLLNEDINQVHYAPQAYFPERVEAPKKPSTAMSRTVTSATNIEMTEMSYKNMDINKVYDAPEPVKPHEVDMLDTI